MVVALPALETNPFIESLELKTFDWRASMEKGLFAKQPSRDIVLLNIDDTTLTLFEDEFGTWPWDRGIHAEMMTWLNDDAHVRALAYDIMFTSPRHGPGEKGDQALIKAFGKYDNVLFSMNLDHNYAAMAALGKAPTDKNFQDLANGGQLEVTEIQDKNEPAIKKYGYNSMRQLLPGLRKHPGRVAIVNHIRDRDGISRSNPLFFQLSWQPECSDVGSPCPKQHAFYPYLGLRLLLNLTNPDTPLVLNHSHVQIGPRVVPLQKDGKYLIRWYNTNAEKTLITEKISQINQQLTQTTLNPREQLQLNQQLAALYSRLEQPFQPYPYLQVSAWRVIQAMRSNTPNNPAVTQLKHLLKNKIVFVGTTAVSTYDIKTTPLHPALPGVILQATLFDNLYQNAHHLVRASPSQNLLATVALWVGCVVSILYTRSVWLGLAGVGVCIVLYVLAGFWVYTRYDIWLSMATPVISATLITTLTYMLRYISRTQDFERTYKLATTDAMTGLKNHRYFQEYLANTIAQTQRNNTPCALIMVDIDFFKKFNDTYGHQAGDRVLQAVARKLTKTVRRGDLVARYGGEEMAVVLTNANTDEALAAAQKLVTAVAEEAYPIAEDVYKHVTISVGVGVCPQHANSSSELIAFADAGLYRAKEAGRNQVGSLG